MIEEDEIFTIELDGAKLQAKADFFRELSAAVDFELAENLDALDEDLADEIPLRCGPYRIVWKNADKSDWSGYSEILKILGLLTHQQQAYPDRFVSLSLEFQADPAEDTWTYPEMYSSPYYVKERERRSRKTHRT
ncbi:MAG: barstar family protein [Pseudomonadota bacterium]